MRRPGPLVIGVAIAVAFGVIYLAGVLPLGLALKAAGAALGLYALLAALQSLPLASARHDLDVFAGWQLPERRRWHHRLKSPLQRAAPPAVGSTERVLMISAGSAAEFDNRLKPRLAAVCRRRLVEAGHDPTDRHEVSSVLGPLGWRVLDPSAPDHYDPRAPGVPVAEVLDLLQRAESLS